MFKKKYSLLISSILIFICSFIFNWYIYDVGLLLSLLIFFIVSIVFIIIFVKSIVNLYSKEEGKKIVAFISIIILSIMVIFNFNFPYVTSKIKVEWNKYEKARYEVVELAKNDKLGFIGDTKIAILPNNYKKISQTGEILIYENSSENQMIGFFINRGMLSGSKILIYSTGGSELIEDNEKYIKNIKKIKKYWYYVETN